MPSEQMSIYYRPDDYNLTISRIYGRVSANSGLLNAIIQHGRRSSLSFYIEEETHFNELQRQFSSCIELSSKLIQPIFHGDVLSLKKADLYLTTDPMLARSAWARSMISSTAYSLCGLTHSVSSLSVVEEIAKLILAPIEPWDAIICTSIAARNVIQDIFQQWYDYLKKYRQFTYQAQLQLPVIPLGIHVNEISCSKDRPSLRKKFREQWNIKQNDFVVLFYGRLSYYEKSHPVPMYLALEALAKRIKKEDSLYCLQAGWFPEKEDVDHYTEAMKMFSPSVKPLFLLKPDNPTKLEMWAGADVFISLVDNIQESFGLTPLEAMANELPVVVSDWDGYKETVRHGVDGFRIPSLSPPSGCGVDLALGYLSNAINYLTYCGLNAQMTAIDINSCTDALWQLYSSAELRGRMGASGRQHVIDKFDWKHIVKQYDMLWDSLTERRLHAQPAQQRPIANPPLLADPYRTYAGYPSYILGSSHLLSLNRSAEERLTTLHANPLCHFGEQQRLPHHLLLSILDMLRQHGPQTVEQIVQYIAKLNSSISSGITVRSLTYLIKYDILQADLFVRA